MSTQKKARIAKRLCQKRGEVMRRSCVKVASDTRMPLAFGPWQGIKGYGIKGYGIKAWVSRGIRDTGIRDIYIYIWDTGIRGIRDTGIQGYPAEDES